MCNYILIHDVIIYADIIWLCIHVMSHRLFILELSGLAKLILLRVSILNRPGRGY